MSRTTVSPTSSESSHLRRLTRAGPALWERDDSWSVESILSPPAETEEINPAKAAQKKIRPRVKVTTIPSI